MRATIALGLVSVFGLAQPAPAQDATNQLKLSNNYFLTGDYVVGGVGLRGLGDTTGFATGTINIPDANSVPAAGVPAGADIVAAFLYWETVEKSRSAFAGQQGFFNGFPITGTILGNPNAPTSWSSGGCGGSSNGTTTLRAYRADVRPFLPVDANGKIQTPNSSTPGSYEVKLADSGSNGGGTPLTLGASLVIIYRVLSPALPLNGIMLIDGAVAPSNISSTMSQQIVGFYQAAASPVVKITHIVGDGQPNKSQSVLVNGVNLPSLYSGLPPFPGVYKQNTISLSGGGSWDNPTWFAGNTPNINTAVPGNAASATTSVAPSGSGSGCVDWGAVIFSITVQDTDGDGLLDVWEGPAQGYTDAISNQFVALPGASNSAKDIFLEIDYLSNLDGLAGPYLHSHLPKQQALDLVGDAFAKQNINVHFDVSAKYDGACKVTSALPNQQACPDPYILQGGSGGNAISESAVVCNDSTTLCQFPGTPAVGWKEGLLFVKNNATVPNSNPAVPLGSFQFGRKDSYHYALFGHALGVPKSFWTSFGATLQSPIFAKLISIVNSGSSAVVTIQSPPGLVKPGDCPNPSIPACSGGNADRISVAGALGQTNLNGTYHFTNLSSSIDGSNVTTTTFTITTTGVTNGTYDFSNEPRLTLMYLGPVSSSGHSDLGGADSAVMFGLWAADDPLNCQADPSQALTPQKPTYCDNQMGSALQQAGTLMHEVGHTLTLTHGGTYYDDLSHPSVPTYEVNCKSNFPSVMSYLFQVRGFPDGGIDYSGQTLPNLSEAALNESQGIGLDLFTSQPAAHLTRWYAPPNALDIQLQNTTGGRFATVHCDGTPIAPNEPPAVRVEGSTFSSPIDWNNNLIVPDAGEPVAWQDVNFNGSTSNLPDPAFRGFNDWAHVDLLQMSARENALGFSAGTGAGAQPQAIGGGATLQAIGGGVAPQAIGGGVMSQAIGGGVASQAIGGGASPQAIGGGVEQDHDTACSTADPPTGLLAVMSRKSVVLSWTPPGNCQVQRYSIWRAKGSFPTLASVLANLSLFTNIKNLDRQNGPPPTTFTDPNVKNNTTYTYFVTDTNVQGATSGPSNPPAAILVRF